VALTAPAVDVPNEELVLELWLNWTTESEAKGSDTDELELTTTGEVDNVVAVGLDESATEVVATTGPLVGVKEPDIGVSYKLLSVSMRTYWK